MDSELLTESAWKTIAAKFKVKSDELQKALATYEKIPEEKYAECRKAIASLVQTVTALKRDEEILAQPEVLKHVNKVAAAAQSAQRENDQAEKASAAAAKAKVAEGGKPADGHTSRAAFVAEQVKELPVTKKIIDQIYPYFPKKYKVISGYLTAGDLYWKVNYHWDAMRVWLEYAKDHKEMNEEEQKDLNSYYKTLMSNPPSQMGHYKINKIGEPADSSSESTIEQRCKTLQQIKADLTAYSRSQSFSNKKMDKKSVLDYALNPLALPKKSNHVHGWALDIAGDIAGAAEIAKKLGATLAFKEFTHCHCEFKSGVKLPA